MTDLLDAIPLVVGLDPSLTASGLAWPSGRVEKWGREGVTSLPYRDRGLALKSLVVSVHNLVMSEGVPRLVVIEELPTSRVGSTTGTTERGYLWWSVLNLLDHVGVPVLVVQPSQLKRYVTGKGVATKGAMIEAVARRLPMFSTHGDDNLADAAGLCAIGCDLLGQPLVPMPEAHRAALAKLTLPPHPKGN